MSKLALIVCGWFVLAMPVQAASFDCGKADAKVEKLVCAHVGLSALDEKLAETYQVVLKQAPDPGALKQRQKDWLEDLRHYCQTIQCLKGAYSTRIRVLLNGDGAKFYDTPALKAQREADKAAKVQAILAQHPLHLRIVGLVEAKDIAFCDQFYESLRTANQSIKYIEPVLRTDDPAHPGLGAYLACDDYEPKDAYVYFMMDEFGSRGFRLYRFDLDGNPKNGLEEYLYGQEPENGLNPAPAHMFSVNFKTCDVNGGIPASPEHPLDPKYNNVISGINALARYHGQYYFYDLAHIGRQDHYYFLELSGYGQSKKSFSPICTWTVSNNQ